MATGIHLPASKIITVRGDKIDMIALGTLRIERLADEYRVIGAHVAYYGALRDEARREVALKKIAHEQTTARIRQVVQEKAKATEQKLTVADVEARISLDESYHASQQELVSREYDYEALGTVISALRTKLSAMEAASADRRLELRSPG